MTKKEKKQIENEDVKKHCHFYLKLSTAQKLKKMSKEQGRKMSTIIDRLVESAR